MNNKDFVDLFKEEENRRTYAESFQNTQKELQKMTLNNKEKFLNQTNGELKETNERFKNTLKNDLNSKKVQNNYLETVAKRMAIQADAKNEHRKVVYEKSKEISLKADDKLEGMKQDICQMSGDELKKKFVDSRKEFQAAKKDFAQALKDYKNGKITKEDLDNKRDNLQDKLVNFTAYKRASLIYVTAKKEKGFSMKDSMASQNVDFEKTKKLVISKKIDSMEKDLDNQEKQIGKIAKDKPDLGQNLKEILSKKKEEVKEMKATQGKGVFQN